jgi:hypothetical protein
MAMPVNSPSISICLCSIYALVSEFPVLMPKTALYRFCIRDFLRDAAFFLMIPLRAALSSFLISIFNESAETVSSFFALASTNLRACERSAVFADLFASLRPSLCLRRFSAELPFFAILLPYLKSDGRRSVRWHFSHSATFFTLPLSKSAFIFTSPPHEQKNFCVELPVRAFFDIA